MRGLVLALLLALPAAAQFAPPIPIGSAAARPTNEQSYLPAGASSATQTLVAWYEIDDHGYGTAHVRATRVSFDGTPLDVPSLRLGDALGVRYLPPIQIASNGRDFLVLHPLQGGNVAVRVSEEGVVGPPVGVDPGPVSIASNSDGYLLASRDPETSWLVFLDDDGRELARHRTPHFPKLVTFRGRYLAVWSEGRRLRAAWVDDTIGDPMTLFEWEALSEDLSVAVTAHDLAVVWNRQLAFFDTELHLVDAPSPVGNASCSVSLAPAGSEIAVLTRCNRRDTLAFAIDPSGRRRPIPLPRAEMELPIFVATPGAPLLVSNPIHRQHESAIRRVVAAPVAPWIEAPHARIVSLMLPRQYAPRSVEVGDRSIVVWSESSGDGGAIMAAVLGEEPVEVATSPAELPSAAVATDGTNVLVVWTDYDVDHVRATLLTASLEPLTSAIVGRVRSDDDVPAVAATWNGREYLVVAQEGHELVAQRLAADLSPRDADWRRLYLDERKLRTPRVIWDGEAYLVTAEDFIAAPCACGAYGRTFASRFSAELTPLTSVDVGGGAYWHRPALSVDPRGVLFAGLRGVELREKQTLQVIARGDAGAPFLDARGRLLATAEDVRVIDSDLSVRTVAALPERASEVSIARASPLTVVYTSGGRLFATIHASQKMEYLPSPGPCDPTQRRRTTCPKP